MPIPANEIIHVEIAVRGITLAGGSSTTPAINIFNYRRTSVVNPFTKSAVSVVFQANVLSGILAAMNVRYTPQALLIRVQNDAQDPPTLFAAPGAGAIITDSLPSSASVYVLLQTALRGRSYRGSKHFGPASEVDTTNDVLTGAGLARWQTVRTSLLTPLVDANANTWVPVILSRKFSQLLVNPTNVVATDVTAALLDLNLGTMRRRRSATIR